MFCDDSDEGFEFSELHRSSKAKGPSPLRMMALCVAELVGTTSSGEGAFQKQPQAKQEDAKQQREDRHDRQVGRQCRDAGVAADPHNIHDAHYGRASFVCQESREIV